jgi:diguanylate cyclase (GGDEF)-like protein
VLPEKTLRVLIVDDDEDDLYLINEALRDVERTRYDVTNASSILLAMVALSKESFDVIFSDFRLGALTGVDFINGVRAAGIDTPIILLTGISDHLVDNAALKAGSSDFIPKTAITANVLDRSVRYALAHADRQRLLQSILKNTKSAISVLDSDGHESLSNAQMTNFAHMAFGDVPNAKQQLIHLAQASTEKDIVVGTIVLEPHITQLPDGSSIVALHDVTDRVNALRTREQAEERIRAIAMQDGLTGIPNRIAFNDFLDDCLLKADSDGSKVAVLLFDFNRFKEVNDLFGHAAGDHILKNAASVLKSVLTDGEFCARLGGDEFVLIQCNSNSEKALDLSYRVVESLSVSLKWEDKSIESSVTLGLALFPDHGQNRQELLANADLAMYRGKAALDRSVYIFDASMDQFVRERRGIVHDLRHAIAGNELDFDLQPQFAALTGELLGFEALLRWFCPSRGNISPAQFIPIAEETGLIIEIDTWVLSSACKLLAKHEWLPRLAINLSARAICQPSIVEQVRTVLLENGISPSRLELEITETALIHDLNRALHNLRQLKAFGISVAMDDFGKGYSSLSLLSSFPFDRIKVDGSFVQMTGNDGRSDALFKAVIALGQALRVPVLVEGIETAQQLEFSESAGCNEIQGYYAGRPIPSKLLPELRSVLGTTPVMEKVMGWQDRNLHVSKFANRQEAQKAS